MCFAITFTTKTMSVRPLPGHTAPGWPFEAPPLSPGGGVGSVRDARVLSRSHWFGWFPFDVDIPVGLMDSGDEMAVVPSLSALSQDCTTIDLCAWWPEINLTRASEVRAYDIGIWLWPSSVCTVHRMCFTSIQPRALSHPHTSPCG